MVKFDKQTENGTPFEQPAAFFHSTLLYLFSAESSYSNSDSHFLHFSLKPKNREKLIEAFFSIYKLDEGPETIEISSQRNLNDSEILHSRLLNRTGWYHLPVKKYATSKGYGDKFLKVYLKSKVQKPTRIRRSVSQPHGQAFLLTFSRDKTKNYRRKRSIRHVRQRRSRKRKQRHNRDVCALHRYHADLEVYSLIVAPKSYSANICKGICKFPLDSSKNATNHAIIQSVSNSVDRNVPNPCCVPIQLDSLRVLMRNSDHSVEIQTLENMVASNCGCR